MQNIYDTRQKIKTIFLLISVILVGGFLYVSNKLVHDLSIEERNKMEFGLMLLVLLLVRM